MSSPPLTLHFPHEQAAVLKHFMDNCGDVPLCRPKPAHISRGFRIAQRVSVTERGGSSPLHPIQGQPWEHNAGLRLAIPIRGICSLLHPIFQLPTLQGQMQKNKLPHYTNTEQREGRNSYSSNTGEAISYPTKAIYL